uniref:Uncharacterized protein n=1 Tax=uncultured Thiotrichaceae bacterium TaxID=298394 RepID=A0A6S6S7Q5_9GAMM|nr:MAG: Unknown protein [uncultured Thiotrichaceae bacterium]
MLPSRKNQTLRQRHLLFGSRELVIKDNEYLLVKERSLLRRHETLIPLCTLQANPTHSSSFSMKWLLNALLTFSISVMSLYWANHFNLPVLYIPCAVFTLTTLLFGYRFFLYTTRLTIFRHASTHENYLFLWRNQPDQVQFDQFIKTLTFLIKANHDPDQTPIA